MLHERLSNGQLSESPSEPVRWRRVLLVLLAISSALAALSLLLPVLVKHELTRDRGDIRVFTYVGNEANLPTWWTVGLLVGGIWASQVQGSPDPRVQHMSLADPKILVAIISWTVYSFALYARRAIGWKGRRAALLSTAGFAIVLLNFIPVGYFLTRSHNF